MTSRLTGCVASRVTTAPPHHWHQTPFYITTSAQFSKFSKGITHLFLIIAHNACIKGTFISCLFNNLHLEINVFDKLYHTEYMLSFAVADPDFPWGGADLVGGRQLPRRLVSKNLYVKMKESGHVGGGHMPAAPPWIRHCFATYNRLLLCV